MKMTAAKAVETSVTSTNNLSQDYTNLDDQFPQTCQIPIVQKFNTIQIFVYLSSFRQETRESLTNSNPQEILVTVSLIVWGSGNLYFLKI